MNDLAFAGAPGIAVLVAYAVIMLAIGFWVSRSRPGVRDTLDNYYLAGRHLGVMVLFFTLYASQYSGNNVVGYAPAAYRMGFTWWQSVTFMTAIIGGYLLFAPRLYAVAKREGFLTPTDWLLHRFGGRRVGLLAALLMLWALANYLLEQLVAMGHGIAGLTGGTVPYQVGVVGFVVVMLAYSWMGGMRAVAFTDVMQGVALLVGVAVMLAGGLYLAGGSLGDTVAHVVAEEPEKAAVPPVRDSVNWLSMVVMVGIGAAVYPHAIQRIYASRSERTLKRSLAAMAWMPLITTGVVFLVGFLCIRLFPGLGDTESEQLVGMLANEVAGINVFFAAMMVLLFGGVIAAIVSTADSVLLSFSSIVSNDIYRKGFARGGDEGRALLVGKAAGIAAVAVLLALAWNPPTLLVNIFVLKFELLIQIVPAFIVGLYWKGLREAPVFYGMAAGALLAGGLSLAGVEDVYGVHGGLVGLALNALVCVAGSLLPARTPAAPGGRTETDTAEAPAGG
ncbi:sodium:solute symporter [Streptomonospora nanhaiensis]|uniref:Na+/proline symporter n=1 Tax=Streptomonospora nanhaiensis TaxID=1323731 RepID=A0A853BMQ1_9ACTN|nr:sodium:solute symporter family protein [Streptomonospora nanhaiensis]MBV2366673.1 sodium:solute symporter family protein [Streptomonospora nanhaiensis]MBX9389974.1 sodium:solute symporter family protein [Streptomonospora nanhaiensis]NYI95985.1 Na+/proline symporter [Streptomonospora nanhaiensis]